MTKSVEQLRRDAEQSRAELTGTVEALRNRISEKTSPEHIRTEVREYIADKAMSWFDQLKHQAMENPLQALAAGTAVALPALRLARAIPVPMLLVGAGFALSSSKIRNRTAEALGPHIQPAKEFVDDAAERARGFAEDARARAASLAEQARQTVQEVRETATAKFDELHDSAAHAAAGVQPRLDHVTQGVGDMRARATEAAVSAPAAANTFIKDNAALIGGLGVVIGAILAASLPTSDTEAKVASSAGAKARRAASAAARSGIDATKGVVLSAADAATDTVKQADLGAHASRMAGNIADTLKTVAADAVTTAFDPSHNPNHSEEAGHE